MMGSPPPNVPDSSGAVLSLLTILGDPDRAKAKLKELGDAQVSMEQATAAHNKALWELNEQQAGFTAANAKRDQELSQKHREVSDASFKLTADVAAHQDTLARSTSDLEKRERVLRLSTAEFERRQQIDEASVVRREQDVTAREAAATAHEAELNSRHSILDDLHEEAMAMKAEAEKRFAALRGLLDVDGPSVFTKAEK